MLSDAFAGLQKLMLPDQWQAQALAELRAGRDVVVDAPTGAGKTYIFERWAEQTNFAKRALFTVPTRALANDKFAEWRARDWKVGIMTGDLCVDPDAPIVVATLEAVQGLIVAPESDAARPGPTGRRFLSPPAQTSRLSSSSSSTSTTGSPIRTAEITTKA